MVVKRLKEFKIWDFYSPIEHRLKFIDANDTPFITWPNGVPCYEANLYMKRQLKTSKSRRVKGGTLRTYAHIISHLITFCYKNKMRISQLTDNHITFFVHTLQGEKNALGEHVRSNNRVIQIARQTLSFLIFVQHIHDLKYFIGEGKENAIRIIYQKHKISIEGSRHKKEVRSLTHSAMPTKDAVKKRLPISEDYANRLWDVIQSQKNKELRLRNTALYQCFDQTGARRTEITMLTVKNIENAIASGGDYPFLQLTTLKRRDLQTQRHIPVTHTLLGNINEYIKRARRKIIKRTIGKANDHGLLFVSLTTGKPLDADSVTTLLNNWKVEAGIEGCAHGHLFRHAFITNKLKEIILKHNDINSKDEFRKHLLNTEKFKMELQQWTGHTQLYSLDVYIDLVFSDLSGYSKTYSAVSLNDSVKLMGQKIDQLTAEINETSITVTEALQDFKHSLDAFKADIATALKVSKVD